MDFIALLVQQWWIRINLFLLASFTTPNSRQRFWLLNWNATGVSKCDKHRNYLGLLSDIDLSDIEFSETDLDL